MKGAFWNLRSLNKLGRLECFKDFIVNNGLDFVGIIETKKESFHESFFKSVGVDFSWNYLSTGGIAGEILLGFINSNF